MKRKRTYMVTVYYTGAEPTVSEINDATDYLQYLDYWTTVGCGAGYINVYSNRAPVWVAKVVAYRLGLKVTEIAR